MSEESVITEELRNMVGVESEPRSFEVERGAIRRFAQAVDDPNPLWRDEDYARQSRYGNIVAPPTFLANPLEMAGTSKKKSMPKFMTAKCPLKKLQNAGIEVECYKPTMPGDVITVRSKLIDLYEKQGRSGKLLFMITEMTYTNQHGELVCKARRNFVRS